MNVKRGMKPKDFSKKWRDLIVEMKFAKFDNIKPEQIARDFVSSTATVLPRFHNMWATNITQFDMGSSLCSIKQVPPIETLLNEFDSWTTMTETGNAPSGNDLSMAHLDGKSLKNVHM
jgi:hypothetical protein